MTADKSRSSGASATSGPNPGILTPEKLRELVKSGEVDTVLTVMADSQGRLVGKRVTGQFFVDEVLKNGIDACAYLLTVDVEMEPLPGFSLASWSSGYQDFHLAPNLTTLRRASWLEATAMVMCDVLHEGSDRLVSVAPRSILAQQVDRAREMGFEPVLASELEFYLFRGTYEDASAEHYHKIKPFGSYIQDYHILQTTKEEYVIREIRNAMNASGIPVEFSKGEWGPGQAEINLRYAPALEMADRHVIYKNAVKEIALSHGLCVTFMAKWTSEAAGSSCHIHTNFRSVEDGSNAFWDDLAQGGSQVFRHFLAGQLAHAGEMALFWAPTVNSYRRFQAGSFAPTRVAWGTDNRTCGLRVVGHRESLRVENRIPGADCNPYLAFAATIAAGLDGIKKGNEPPAEVTGNAYEMEGLRDIPRSLPEASDRLAESSFALQALGDEVVDHYLTLARHEQAFFERSVTDVERMRYFERI